MPEQKPGLSRQDYETPEVFLEAIKQRFDITAFTADLAASTSNARAARFFTESDDSLKQDWMAVQEVPSKPMIDLWLNPPFGHIEPWARKCAESVSRKGNVRIFFLTPASVGANWFDRWILPNALVLALRGRLSFDGKAPFPQGLHAVGFWR
jgi:phage N-6-adenine-methyltransferase